MHPLTQDFVANEHALRRARVADGVRPRNRRRSATAVPLASSDTPATGSDSTPVLLSPDGVTALSEPDKARVGH